MMSQLSQSCETNMYAADTKTNPLHKVTMSKYLGMFINFNLKWDDHINNMTPKISAKLVSSAPIGMLFMTLLPKQARPNSRSSKPELRD